MWTSPAGDHLVSVPSHDHTASGDSLGYTPPPAGIPPFLQFWGKASDGGDSWHPAAYHCLDVAACVERILAVRPLALDRAVHLFGAEPADTSRFLTVLAAIHDIGKFATFFQAKRADLWPQALGEMPTDIPPAYHTRDGFCFWYRSLRENWGAALWAGDRCLLSYIVQAVTGHHGRPIAFDAQRDVLSAIYKPAGRSAAEAFAATVMNLLAPQPLRADHLEHQDALRATWWVAGLITAADWIGSNELWFKHHEPMPRDPDLHQYWELARSRAAAAVREAGLESPGAARHRTFVELTDRTEPTPAQRWANEVPLPEGPALFILEDVTGAGKTEAAQVLIHRLMAAGRASGAFWAMPTRATANAMYGRQAKSLRALFDDAAAAPSLVLAHGKSRLHEGFRNTVIEEPGGFAASNKADADDVPGEIACAAFLANSARTAMIADIGAGTVDQAILSVLPSKFNTLRLFGLAEKVLVLDEIHAYDAYMAQELKALLRFHAELGGSAIALSATLSAKLSKELTAEWRHAVTRSSQEHSAEPPRREYPLATVVGRDVPPAQFPLKAAEWSRRSVAVRLVHDDDAVIEELLRASRSGAAAVWIRNTVDSCRKGAEDLRRRGAANVSVFHARFAQCDRQRREDDVLARFGPKSGVEREGCILVATQVVEQSLDLDFDVMVSDLAPIDLLIQRTGRLWRHSFRNSRVGAGSNPELLVLTPQFDENPSSDWLEGLLPKTKWVYQDPAVLWRTLRVLREAKAIEPPDGLRDLIERVYADDTCPPNLQSSADRAQGAASAATGTARQYTLKIGDGYIGESLLWSSDVRVPTRLSDHQTTIRLGRVIDDGSVAPWAEPADPVPPWHAWALSEIRVSLSRVPMGSAVHADHRVACDAVRATWGRWEQEIPLVPLRRAGTRWSGQFVTPKGETRTIDYDDDSGLSFDAPSGATVAGEPAGMRDGS